MLPRRSTWSLTPSSNMSAAGAMITSATSACASIRLPSSEAGLQRRLVDRAGDDVGRAERERRGDRRRRPEPTRRADADRPRVVVLVRQLVAELQDRREQRHQRLVVGVTAGVGLDGDVLGHRDLRGEAGLFLRQPAAGDEGAQHLLRRGERNGSATSRRESLAKMCRGRTIRPAASSRSPRAAQPLPPASAP